MQDDVLDAALSRQAPDFDIMPRAAKRSINDAEHLGARQPMQRPV